LSITHTHTHTYIYIQNSVLYTDIFSGNYNFVIHTVHRIDIHYIHKKLETLKNYMILYIYIMKY